MARSFTMLMELYVRLALLNRLSDSSSVGCSQVAGGVASSPEGP
jgi:hypothetical protein